ncbi:MAG: hypothetical protein CVV06_06625 [Gammaproteobacteria bacterium HGW-Gammaproteobacteria-10]|nr:MAG: hypothetical protein CVV06_06625 [Gammaproteobacteria bacterium HGW-Gammaproteobacteria-10]
MLSIIDPNVDYVWNSVATISTREGIEERRPQTDDDWQLVRQHALTLVEASNLLLIEGRKVAVQGASTSIDPVELSPQDIQRLIDANRSDYVKRAHSLHNAAQLFLAAIDKKDVDELVQAGGVVEQACEGCHSQFWYPNDNKPQ